MFTQGGTEGAQCGEGERLMGGKAMDACPYCGGPKVATSSKCRPCYYNRPRRWPREEIIAAIQAWIQEHGRPPRAAEWKLSGGATPPEHTVRMRFGSWSAAIRVAHGGPVSGEYMIPADRLRPICEEWLASPRNHRDHLTNGLHAFRLVTEGDPGNFVSERAAEQLLIALDREDAWHVELADITAELIALASESDLAQVAGSGGSIEPSDSGSPSDLGESFSIEREAA